MQMTAVLRYWSKLSDVTVAIFKLFVKEIFAMVN